MSSKRSVIKGNSEKNTVSGYVKSKDSCKKLQRNKFAVSTASSLPTVSRTKKSEKTLSTSNLSEHNTRKISANMQNNTIHTLKLQQHEEKSATETIIETTAMNNMSLPSPSASIRENDVLITPKIRNNLSKLSLTKKKNASVRVSNASSLEISNFLPNKNSTVHEPLRILRNKSITVSDIDQSKKRQDTADSKNKKEKATWQNLAHKTDVIADLLNFDEDKECEDKQSEYTSILQQNQAEIGMVKNTERRFFHRTAAPLESNSKSKNKAEIVATKGTKKANRSIRSSFRKKQSTMRDNVYEFLSQSQTSESDTGKHKDPAADIIQKLIKAGKVRVATNCKGKGRPIVKRARRGVRKIGKRAIKNKIQVVENAKIDAEDLDDRPFSPIFNEPGYEPEQDEAPTSPTIHEQGYHSIDGRFSNLARSVLLNQTEKSESNRNNFTDKRRRLLEFARNFVSTPANEKNGSLQSADLSPISPPPKHAATSTIIDRPACPSPWRVDNESHLPNVFYFSKNTSHLPSFSCDYIPLTPKKNVINRSSHFKRSPEKLATQTETDNTVEGKTISNNISSISQMPSFSSINSDAEIMQTEIDDTVKEKSVSNSIPSTSQMSSYSSIDSNAENLPPPTPLLGVSNNENTNLDVNADIFNKRQLPNPHQMQSHRSPLKAVNILEVVCLPSWKKLKSPEKSKPAESATKSLKRKSDKRDDDGIFGFEELIDDSGDDFVETDNNAKKIKKSHKHLHTKLRELRKFLPVNKTLTDRKQTKPISRIVGYGEGTSKQRGIKEMLCSTMINPPEAQQIIHSDSDDNSLQQEQPAQKDEPVLFKDFEPDITFDPKRPHRTYENPKRNKRKMRHNFVMFPHSDIESEEETEREQKKRQKVKVKDKPDKSDEQLKSFVDEFNSMCTEVENYELMVE